ncbi:MAG: dTDP-glucose 4,6-dehydratase [Candidatus Omnitrophota bacterium]
MRILVTGGCGFIGSNFILYLLKNYPGDSVINLDKLTYAANPKNLEAVADNPRYIFVKGDICDGKLVSEVVAGCDAIINFAAESHVDRSITEPAPFIQTNINGTAALLESCRRKNIPRFVQISSDEVYGSIKEGTADEESPLRSSSPYSASKASADLLCLSYYTTHRTPVLITRSSNNYGPRQYPEKLVPLFITLALADKPVPLYGDGQNERDWLFVEDNCRAIDLVLRQGKNGEIYNIGTDSPVPNIEIVKILLDLLGKPLSLIRYVPDRPGHDWRYAINWAKIKALGWQPSVSLEDGLKLTIPWYRT